MNDTMHSIIENFGLEVSRLSDELVHKLKMTQSGNPGGKLGGDDLGGTTPGSSEPTAPAKPMLSPLRAIARARETFISYLRWRTADPKSRGESSVTVGPDIMEVVDNLCEFHYKRGVSAGLTDRLSEVATSIKIWARQRGGAHRDIFDGPEEIHDGIRECFNQGVKCGWDSTLDSVSEYLQHWINHRTKPDRHSEPAFHAIAKRRPAIHKAILALDEAVFRAGRDSHPTPCLESDWIFNIGLPPTPYYCALRKLYMSKFDGMPPYRPESKPLETYINFCEEQYNKLEAQCKKHEESCRALRSANLSLSSALNKAVNEHVRELAITRETAIAEALTKYKAAVYPTDGSCSTTPVLDSMVERARAAIKALEAGRQEDEREDKWEGGE